MTAQLSVIAIRGQYNTSAFEAAEDSRDIATMQQRRAEHFGILDDCGALIDDGVNDYDEVEKVYHQLTGDLECMKTLIRIAEANLRDGIR